MKHLRGSCLALVIFLAGCPDSNSKQSSPTPTPAPPQETINPLDTKADLGVPKDAKATNTHSSGTASGAGASAHTDNNYVPSHFDSPRYTQENWRTWEYVKGNSVKSLRRKNENGKWLYRLEVNNTSPPTITYFEAEDLEAAEKNF